VAERTADLATGSPLLISAPELHYTPERLRRADGTSRFRAKGHEIYTTAILIEAEARLLEAGRETDGPTVAPGHWPPSRQPAARRGPSGLSIDQANAVEQIATSGADWTCCRDPAGTGKSTTMAGLRAVWEARTRTGSVLGWPPQPRPPRCWPNELGDRDGEHGQVAP
jgi:hypothetical protein